MLEPNQKKSGSVATRLAGYMVLLALAFAGAVFFVMQPSPTRHPPTKMRIPQERLRRHVAMLAERFAPRSGEDHANLSHCAAYIASQFRQTGARVTMPEFEVGRRMYRNVVASFGPEAAPRIVIGAHYDTYGDSPGADSNASGVAGLIELAYLLDQAGLNKRVDLVAFTLEEEPYFRTPDMGSVRYAQELRRQQVDLVAMVALESIGYFSDEPGSQTFPYAMLRWFYPDTGNYISVVGSPEEYRLVKALKSSMKGSTDLPVYSLCVPRDFPGAGLSDHWGFWKEGYPAVMVTDTAYFRNEAYHTAMDIPIRLDFDRMAKVVLGVYEAVVDLAD